MTFFLKLFSIFMIAHVVCDYPLQGDFLAKAKNRTLPSMGGCPAWLALISHAAMHAGAVWYISGFWFLGAAEFVAHSFIDDCKCTGKITFVQDQALHLLCKLAWVFFIFKNLDNFI